MLRHKSIASGLAGLLFMGLFWSVAQAAPITVPTGLNPGDQYRIAFLTTTTRNASSSDIAVYNAFVTAEANSVAELSALNTTWTAIASTATVDARDNTDTNPASAGVGIYLLNDTKLADNNADLWDGTIRTALGVQSDGFGIVGTTVWTGTASDGTVGVQNGSIQGLGFEFTGDRRLGNSGFEDQRWIMGPPSPFSTFITFNAHFYAISGILTVGDGETVGVPEPAPLSAMALGLLSFAVIWRRRAAEITRRRQT
mgnify:CR=1 FL=1